MLASWIVFEVSTGEHWRTLENIEHMENMEY